MDRQLANFAGEVPERFVPDLMRATLAEAEHLNRYHWAAEFCRGRRVLDAGCGMAYGSAVVGRAGAREVVGVDLASSVIEAARWGMPPSVTLETADITALPYPDGSFDAVVCFEVIEHIEEPGRVLDELTRVLVRGGLLIISSPNRDVYVPGNPHHHHEFKPAELEAELSNRFASVRLFRQSDWVTSAILDDDGLGLQGGALEGLQIHLKAVGIPPGDETYTLAIATDGEQPPVCRSGVLSHTADEHRWLDLYEEQQAIIRANVERIDELESVGAERNHLRSQLREAEQALSAVQLRQFDELRKRIIELETLIAAVSESRTWRMTESLRGASRAVRRIRRG